MWVLWIALGWAADIDSDGFDDADGSDNCPGLFNPDQADDNTDGYGDACISPEATISPSAVLGFGAQVRARAVIEANVSIGPNTLIGAASHIGEDAVIGSGVVIGRRVQVGARVTVGDDAGLARSAHIGADASIGLGAAVGYAAVIEEGASVGSGSVLGSLSRVAAAATIDGGVVVARSAIIDTCAVVASGTVLGPETQISAFADVGSGTRIRRGSSVGAAAVVGTNARIGRNTIVGPGAAVASGGAIRANANVPTCMSVPAGTPLLRGETATSVAGECAIVLSEDQGGDDIWTTSVFSSDGVAQRPGGGRNDDLLRVGGWGDTYLSLIEFDIAGLPGGVSAARVELFRQTRGSGTTTNFYVDRITESWDYRNVGTGRDLDRLWWADRPSTTPFSGSITPVAAENWQPIDITSMYNNWSSGLWSNSGLSLRPASTSNSWVLFQSSNACTADLCTNQTLLEAGDRCRAPRLVLTP